MLDFSDRLFNVKNTVTTIVGTPSDNATILADEKSPNAFFISSIAGRLSQRAFAIPLMNIHTV